jgi:hypothetical protein
VQCNNNGVCDADESAQFCPDCQAATLNNTLANADTYIQLNPGSVMNLNQFLRVNQRLNSSCGISLVLGVCASLYLESLPRFMLEARCLRSQCFYLFALALYAACLKSTQLD